MKIAQQNQLWAAVLADHLPRTVVVSPGSRSTPLVLAFASKPHAPMHCILDERTAGFFALGLARASGKAVILVCTSGSAAAHYLPALIEANLSGIPLLVLTADRPPEMQHCGAPQTIDQAHLFGRHVRWFADVGAPHGDGSPRWLRGIAAQALDRAEGATPGPVHVNVPFREPLWQPEPLQMPEAVPPFQVMRGATRLAPQALQALATRLSQATRGVIVAGAMPPNPALRTAVTTLAQRLGWPLLPEIISQLRAGDSPNTVTAYDALLHDADFAQAQAPTLALRFGQPSTSKVTGQWLAQHCADSTILVHPQGRWLDPHHSADTLIAANAELLVQDLLPMLPQKPASPWLAGWQEAERAARRALDAACQAGFWEAAVAHAVHAALPVGGALHVASSMPVRDLDSFAPSKDVTVFANRGANGIDGTLACALGTAAAWKQGPTVLLSGDLAFLHDVGALQLAHQMTVSLTVVVVNNHGGGIFDFLPIAQQAQHFERFFRTPQKANISALAQAAGAHAQQVHDTPALAAALEASWQRAGLTVIEAVMPADDSNVARHRAAWAAVRAG